MAITAMVALQRPNQTQGSGNLDQARKCPVLVDSKARSNASKAPSAVVVENVFT